VACARLISRSANNPNRPYYTCSADSKHFFKWAVSNGAGGGGTWESMVKRGTKYALCEPFYADNDHFAKTGSGQT
jgi:hypothetical protein